LRLLGPRRTQAWHFDSLDSQVEDADKAGLDIILTVGQKAPRWPEFHVPAWTSWKSQDFEQRVLTFVDGTVRHFAAAQISVWQIENEPFLSFGGPSIPEDLLRREIELVRGLDDRPIMLTDSADKGDWARSSRWSDILGVNLYTKVWNGRRYVDINVPPSRYEAKMKRLSSKAKEVIVAELQAEPWGPRGVTELSPAEAAVTMNADRLRQNAEIASKAGFHTVLFWGVEWWYWLRERGDASMWEEAKAIVGRT